MSITALAFLEGPVPHLIRRASWAVVRRLVVRKLVSSRGSRQGSHEGQYRFQKPAETSSKNGPRPSLDFVRFWQSAVFSAGNGESRGPCPWSGRRPPVRCRRAPWRYWRREIRPLVPKHESALSMGTRDPLQHLWLFESPAPCRQVECLPHEEITCRAEFLANRHAG